jgi:NAD-dependent dihydropyrimidine dehydrogenase PreA subunit
LSDQRLRTTSNSTGERAAARPDSCNDISGRVAPVVDRDRCEGKADCVRVCPFDVFEIGTLSKQQRRALSLVGRLKAWAHDGKQAFVVNPLDCHACRLCVDACPEHALQLAPLQP